MKKVCWLKQPTTKPKPEDLSIPQALWKILDKHVKRAIILTCKLYSDNLCNKKKKFVEEKVQNVEQKQYGTLGC